MPVFVANCPRCNSNNMTFDLTQENYIGQDYGWKLYYEVFCICRQCHKSTVFIISLKDIDSTNHFNDNGLLKYNGAINDFFDYERFVSLKDMATSKPPKYLPKNIDDIFSEGAVCMAVKCFNAAGTMFRLCIDLATRSMLPEDDIEDLNRQIRRNLGSRLKWLFNNCKLPEGLKELSECIKDDGNDGAHQGNLTEKEAEDLLDFTFAMLERLYTEPEKLKLAKERRNARQNKK